MFYLPDAQERRLTGKGVKLQENVMFPVRERERSKVIFL